jgi:hypothetical protein
MDGHPAMVRQLEFGADGDLAGTCAAEVGTDAVGDKAETA